MSKSENQSSGGSNKRRSPPDLWALQSAAKKRCLPSSVLVASVEQTPSINASSAESDAPQMALTDDTSDTSAYTPTPFLSSLGRFTATASSLLGSFSPKRRVCSSPNLLIATHESPGPSLGALSSPGHLLLTEEAHPPLENNDIEQDLDSPSANDLFASKSLTTSVPGPPSPPSQSLSRDLVQNGSVSPEKKVTQPPKKRLGRPKGSLNKKTLAARGLATAITTPAVPKKRGRPPKVRSLSFPISGSSSGPTISKRRGRSPEVRLFFINLRSL